MSTFIKANNLTVNTSKNIVTIAAISSEVANPPVKSRNWTKKTIWKNGRSHKSFVAHSMRKYRPGRYLTEIRFKGFKSQKGKK
jgi:hypothetical protein